MRGGGKSLYAVAPLGRDHTDDLADWRGGSRRRTPGGAPLHRVFRRRDGVRFAAVRQPWLPDCLAHVPAPPRREAGAVDGKTLCGSQGHLRSANAPEVRAGLRNSAIARLRLQGEPNWAAAMRSLAARNSYFTPDRNQFVKRVKRPWPAPAAQRPFRLGKRAPGLQACTELPIRT